MKPVEIKKGIYYVGVQDPGLRVFDIVMDVEWGTSYNAYLVIDRKRALIDNVKSEFTREFMDGVKSLCDPGDLDYIIVNHSEPDHNGCLAQLLELAPQAEVLCTNAAYRFLKQIVNRDFPVRVVADGEELDLGERRVQFIHAPFLHWPDSMFSYFPDDRILFTCDAFGCHYANGEGLFDDQVPESDHLHAYRYYFDAIMSPFKPYVRQALQKIRGLEIDLIAPGHGPILRKDPWKFVDLYEEWSEEEERGDPSVAVIYVSAYGNTKKMAQTIAEGLREGGIQADLYDVSEVGVDKAVAAAVEADGILLGSPTFNRDAVKPIWAVLSRLSPIGLHNKPAGAFGSYGWSGEAVKLIEDRLRGLTFKLPLPGVRANFVPSREEQEACLTFGREFASAAKEWAGAARGLLTARV